MENRLLSSTAGKSAHSVSDRDHMPSIPRVPKAHSSASTPAPFSTNRRALIPTLLNKGAPWLDTAVVCAVAYLAFILSGQAFLTATIIELFPHVMLTIAALWSLRLARAYRVDFSVSAWVGVRRVAMTAGLSLGAMAIALYVLKALAPPAYIFGIAITMWIALISAHISTSAFRLWLLRTGRFSENVILIGATENARKLVDQNIETRELNIVGVFDDRMSRVTEFLPDVPLLGCIDDMMNWEHLPDMDRIVVTVSSDARDRVRQLINRLRILPQQVVLLLDLNGFNPERESLSEIGNAPAAVISGSEIDADFSFTKRISDLFFSTVLLIGFSPFMFMIAIAIRLDSPGPILFRQKRHGFNNEIIRVWKFRSMKVCKGAEERMQAQTTVDDPRVTRVGRFIRRTSLDELPQLFNVLKGEMSVVGPRPHAVGMQTDQTEVHAIVSDYAHRHRMKPGITGWAQINGSRGPVNTREEVHERVKLDMKYINTASIGLDLYIMLMTAPCLLGDSKRPR